MNRRQFLKTLGVLSTAGIAAGCGGAGYISQIEPTWIWLESITIPLIDLPESLDGFKIVQISDVHLYPHTQIETVQHAVTLANSVQPDLVVLTGDYVLETADAIFDLAPALAGINAQNGIFAILGNHDLWTNETVVRHGLEQNGIEVLRNQGVTLPVGQDGLYLAGLDDGWSGRPDLPAALAAAPPEIPVLLLMHEPDFADTAAGNGRVAVQLSGHSHGGQVRLPGIGAPILPYLGEKYDIGLNRVADMWVYTNRGLGVIGPPVRFNCPPEVTAITLTRSQTVGSA